MNGPYADVNTKALFGPAVAYTTCSSGHGDVPAQPVIMKPRLSAMYLGRPTTPRLEPATRGRDILHGHSIDPISGADLG